VPAATNTLSSEAIKGVETAYLTLAQSVVFSLSKHSLMSFPIVETVNGFFLVSTDEEVQSNKELNSCPPAYNVLMSEYEQLEIKWVLSI
jgi:hypothetical protein